MKHYRIRAGFLALMLLGTELFFPGLAFSADDTLVMGIFPSRNAATTITLYKPMATYLSDKLGVKVKLVTTRDFPSFWKGVAEQQYDIVHYNQYHYIKSHDAYGYEVILKNEEFGKSFIAASILARRDSGIHRLQDLEGKRIMFGGDRNAMISYVIPTLMLRRAGLKAGDYRELFAKNPPNACIGIYYKQADAGGTGDIAVQLPVVKNKIDVTQLKTLATSEPLQHLPWAVKSDMNTALRNRIQELLASLNTTTEGRTILSQAKLTNLISITDKQYDTHRTLIKELQER